IKFLREYLNARRRDILLKQTESPGSKQIDEEQLVAEAHAIIATMEARNRSILAHAARADALHEYVEMVIVIIECCSMDQSTKLSFILRMLQIMLPKLDVFIVDERDDVMELARAVDALLFSLSETATSNSHLDNIITEKLFQLFRASIEGITAS